MSLEIITVPCRSDNYAYLLRDLATGRVGVVDVPDAEAIKTALGERDWPLDMVLITHHHHDHIVGVEALREVFGAQVAGAAADQHRLPPLDVALKEGDEISLGQSRGRVIDVSGHTIGHIAYYFATASAVFTADSLMALGCGRLFEGDPQMMWASLQKLAALPSDTLVYSGHEYTQANARFALSIDADNAALVARSAEIDAMRAKGQPTVPVRLETEQATNPFLRASSADMKRKLEMTGAGDAETFGHIRKLKDSF